MATTAGSAAGAAARGTRRWVRNRQNRRALTRFSEFWMALQAVGDVLAEAEKLSKNADDGAWANRGSRHWTIATPEEIR